MSGRHVSVSTVNRLFLARHAINPRRTIPVSRGLATTNARWQDADSNGAKKQEDSSAQDRPKEDSAMARRLSEMTEDALVEGGRSAQKNIQEAGFSEDLKEKLLERVAASTFKSDYATAHSIADMPVCVLLGSITEQVLMRCYRRAQVKELVMSPELLPGRERRRSLI